MALASPPGPPWSYALAGAALANGLAQVKSIMSTNIGSGAGAAAAPSTPSAPAAPEAPRQSTLYVEGIDPNGMFTGPVVRDLAQRLIDYQRDGGQVLLAPR
jgi:hypothetical protein